MLGSGAESNVLGSGAESNAVMCWGLERRVMLAAVQSAHALLCPLLT